MDCIEVTGRFPPRNYQSNPDVLDRSGYPDAPNGDEISDLVRLSTISDIFAALI
jgi:hypothetical protein